MRAQTRSILVSLAACVFLLPSSGCVFLAAGGIAWGGYKVVKQADENKTEQRELESKLAVEKDRGKPMEWPHEE